MITRLENHNHLLQEHDHPAAHALERDGHLFLGSALPTDTIAALRAEIDGVFRSTPPDSRDSVRDPVRAPMFRYAMCNRSALCQEIIARREILDVLEPLLGEDCHVVSCTAWRNPPGNEHAPLGQDWHVDGGPHVVRPEGTEWPAAIPYPIFVVAVHIYLDACALDDGPTAVLTGSHRSGCLPPRSRRWDLDLEYEGAVGVAHVAEPGDLTFFVSDVWHRRLPPQPNGTGRFFLQVNYGRREIAQRVLPPDVHNSSNEASRARARSVREQQLLGIHPQGFYDA